MVISGKVKLKTGEIREVRYLDKDDWAWIKGLLEKYSMQPNIDFLLEDLRALYSLIAKILGKEIIEFYKDEIRDKISLLPIGKSFRWANLNRLLEGPSRYPGSKSEAFDELIAEGLIIDRGVGWYRRAET